MLSRVADTIYWMNRYIERAENYARFMDVNFNLSLDLPPNQEEQWKPLVLTTGDWPLYTSMHEEVTKSKVIRFLGFEKENPNSIFNSIRNARENARAIRPEITKEVWEQINYLYHTVMKGANKKSWQVNELRAFFNEIKIGCQLLYGIFDATISRTDGWHFGKIGQLIERADKTSRVLDVKYHILLSSPKAVGSAIDLIQWAALLKSVSAYDMYRKKNGKLNSLEIAAFLILDNKFPRSILRCLMGTEYSLRAITGSDSGYINIADKKLGKLKSKLEYDDINEIFESGLHEYLDNIQRELMEISDSIYQSFFSSEYALNNEKIMNQQ